MQTPHKSNCFRLSGILATICFLLPSLPAFAGEYYLRLGVALDQANDTNFTDRNCLNLYPWALYGCGTGGDGLPYRSNGEFHAEPSFELGLGYSATSRFRAEVVAEKRRQIEFVGLANFLALEQQQDVVASIESTLGLLVAHMDLMGRKNSPFVGFTPFIGIGFGFVRNECSEMRMDFPSTITTVPGDTRSDFAGVLTIGVSFALNKERTVLELAWRHLDLGEIRTDRDVGQVEWRSGIREPLHLDLDQTRARLKSRGIKLSLRHRM